MRSNRSWTCGELAGNCDCTKNDDQVPPEPVTTGTYTIDGATLTMDDGQTLDFCVDGAGLRARWKDANGTDQTLIVGEKQ